LGNFKNNFQKVLEKIGLKKGDKVLSIGCGIGGGEIMMNQKYGAIVHAIDLSQNMLSIARHHVEKTETD
jgi:phosphoethanolamine N-methyltransferase